MKTIAIICPYPQGVAPSQRLKYEQYIADWRDNGYCIDIFPFQSYTMWKIVYQKGKWLQKIYWTMIGYFHRFLFLFQIRNYDIVYIHLWVTPFGIPLFERLYRLFAKKIIYDIDDLIFMGHSSEANRWIASLKGKQKPIYLIQKSDYIITTTPYLVDFCKQYNTDVVGIPPTLPSHFITSTTIVDKPRLTIGWSGSKSTSKYLELIAVSLQQLSQNYAIELLLFGVENYEIKGVKIRCISWSEETEKNIFSQMDIAIYPLEKEKWSEGKYGGKLIQYFAAGLPIVASKANEIISMLIENSHNGICIDNSNENWYNALSNLIEHTSMRKTLASNAYKTFEEKFSCEKYKPIYLNILNSVLEN